MTNPSKPIPDCYWVVPGQLCVGEYPSGPITNAAREKLRRFLDAGFTFFLVLSEEPRLASYAPLLLEEAAARGISVELRRIPVPYLGTPTQTEVTHILDTLDAAIAAGHCVYVHCLDGVGGTGTIVGCYLARHGITSNQALVEIERLDKALRPRGDSRRRRMASARCSADPSENEP